MFSVNFLANQYVSDVDINAVGYNLANTVYTSFNNDTVYGVNELNAITSHMMSKGVKRNYKNECSVTLNEGIVHIDSGLAFFDNGATISIDEDGIDLTVVDNTEQQYIYLFFDESLNVAGARCGTLPEANVSYVMLGTIADGIVTQNRTFSFLNVDVKGSNEVLVVEVEPVICYVRGKVAYEYSTPFNITKYRKIYFSACIEKSAVLFGVVDVINKIVEFRSSGDNYQNGSFDAGRLHPYKSISDADKDSQEQIIDGILHIRTFERFPKMIFEIYGGAED